MTHGSHRKMPIMSYRKRDPFDDPMYMDRDHPPALAYDNYAMYDNSVISGQSMWGKFHHSSSYRLKGSDSGSSRSSGPSRGCRRCIIVTAVLLCLGALGAVVGIAVYFSVHPCENYTLIEAIGIQCATPVLAKLMSPKDQMEFCQLPHPAATTIHNGNIFLMSNDKVPNF
uniref:Uncharacterized protein n=1 Tax=Magallana gigas TaxID=29159 RepID=K1QEV4_MAGGI